MSRGTAAGDSIENESFRVTGEADGTLTLEDKRSGGALRGLNWARKDGGEGGDEYTYNPPQNDEIVRGTEPAWSMQCR